MAAITAAHGLFTSLLFGSTPIVIRCWKEFTCEWFMKQYLPKLCSRLKIMDNPDVQINEDENLTAAGL